MNSKVAVVLAVVILLLAGAFFMMKSKKTSETSIANSTGGLPTKAENKNVFTSIKDALSKSVTLECTFTDEEGRKTKSYIKNGAVRSDVVGKTADESGSVIMKDKKMYYWNTKTAFMMTFDFENVKPSGTTTQQNTTTSTSNGANLLDTMEKYKNDCKPSVVADSLFTPPTNVKFTDYSELFKPPVANPSGGTMNEQQVQDLLKKYAPTETP